MDQEQPQWTAAEADAAVATGRVPMCWWCGVPIVRDTHGTWVHTTRAYKCRHPTLGWLPHTAQPRAAAKHRVLPVTGRRAI